MTEKEKPKNIGKSTTIERDSDVALQHTKDKNLSDLYKQEFQKDMSWRVKNVHPKMNYHYLQYKGILALNRAYGEEYLKTIGLQVSVPRTFMTVEAIKPSLSGRPLDIDVEADKLSAEPYEKKAKYTLKGEWKRSKADWAKSEAQSDALIFGTGWLISRFIDDQTVNIYEKENGDKIETVTETMTRYKGMRAFRLDPYTVFPDRHATTDMPYESGSWQRCWVYSLWDYDVWQDICDEKGYNVEGMEKGGTLEDFGKVRKIIDTLYIDALSEVRTRQDDNQLVTPGKETQVDELDTTNMIMVVECFEEERYSVFSGANWTINTMEDGISRDNRIPVTALRDYVIPGEFDGVGEPEVLRWQQYEENKIHNLSYMQVLTSTVQRYAVVEELLKDPTEARASNPFKPIRLKYRPGISINQAIQPMNQGKGTAYPQQFLNDVKNIGQSATGITDFFIGASNTETNTATEANRLANATTERIRQKIYEMEERDLVRVLQYWLVNIPYLYDDELDLKIHGEDDKFFVKFLPMDSKNNKDVDLIAEYSTKMGLPLVSPEGVKVQTLEELFIAGGYRDVVFIDEITNQFDITIKTATATGDKMKQIGELRQVLTELSAINQHNIAVGLPPEFKVGQIGRDLLKQFDEIIKNVDDYIYSDEEKAMVSGAMQAPPPIPEQPLPEQMAQQVNQPIL
jgi:hypothetical protein